MRHPIRGTVRVYSVICGFFLTTACAGVLTPQIVLTEKEMREYGSTAREYDALSGLQLARLHQSQYDQASGNFGKLSTYGGLSLIGLGAITTGYLANDVGGDTALLAGFSGATLFSAGNYLSNRPRVRAYHMGYNAVSCAIAAYRPLHFEQGDYRLKRFEDSLKDNGLPQSIQETSLALTSLRLEYSSQTSLSTAQRNVIESLMDAATQDIAKAREAETSGAHASNEISSAEGLLKDALDRIRGDVNQSISENLSDFQAARNSLAQIADIYSEITTIPETLRSAQGSSEPSEGEAPNPNETASERASRVTQENSARNSLVDKAENLSKQLEVLNSHTARVNNFVTGIKESRPDRSLAECGIDPATIVSPMSLSDTSLRVIEGGEFSPQIHITGGVAPFSIIAAENDASISVEMAYPNSRIINVKVSDAAKAGTRSVSVVDATGGRTASFSITIEKKVEEQSTTGGAETPAPKTELEIRVEQSQAELAQAGLEFESAEVKALQSSICMKESQIDGIWGKISQTAFESLRKKEFDREPIPPGPRPEFSPSSLTPTDIAQLSALSSEQISAACSAESD